MSFQEALQATHGPRHLNPAPAPRTPALVRLWAVLAALVGIVAPRLALGWRQFRTHVLSIGGFGFLCAAAWTFSRPAGLAAIGVSLLVFELLSGDEAK